MCPILGNALLPHPPIIVPEVGKENVLKAEQTIVGVETVAKKIVALEPETLIIITPHGPLFQDALILWEMPKLVGGLADFAAPEVKMSWENDLELVEKIVAEATQSSILAVKFSAQMAERYNISSSLDHACLVPLYYLQKSGFQGKIVIISMSLLPYAKLYAFGAALGRAVGEKKVVVLSSGDLSHRLSSEAPSGFHPQAHLLDEKIIQAVKEAKVEDLIYLDDKLIENGGECGLRSFIIGMGSLDGWEIKSEVKSYEAPFGVGYLTAFLQPTAANQQRIWAERFVQEREEKIKERRAKESQLVRLARETVEAYIKKADLSTIKQELSAELPKRAGVFVSLKKNGHLRGCIGTIAPTRSSLQEEVMANALSAALRDSRFSPLEEEELADIVYSIDILGEPEKIESIKQLDVKKYGLIVQKENKSGLLLPDLDGVETVEQQLEIAKQKAGLKAEEKDVELYRFTVERYS